MSSKDMSEHILHYRNVFFYLLLGTAITVCAAYLDFNVENSMAGAIFVGLAIASVKGYLVAANFMHLKSEKPMINWTLILTVFFLIVLLSIPLLWDVNNMGNMSNHPIWNDVNNSYNNQSY